MEKRIIGLLVGFLVMSGFIFGCGQQVSDNLPEVLKIVSRVPLLNAGEVASSDNLSLTFNFPIDISKLRVEDLFAAYGSSHTAGTPDLSEATLECSADQKTLVVKGIKAWLNPTSGGGPRVVELAAVQGKIRDIFGNEIRPGKTLWQFTLKDPTIAWTRTYDDVENSWDAGNSIAVDASGNVYVTGYETLSGQSGNAWVGKYDKDGNVLWTRTHNGSANDWDEGDGIAVDGNGNVYVTGAETVTGQSGNIWIRKYDRNGNELWTRTHDGNASGWDTGRGIAVDANGNVYVTGYELVTGQERNIWVRKYDGNGNELWTSTYNGADNGSDGGYGIAVDGSGNVYVTGYESVAGQDKNIWIRKYNGNGNALWTRTHDGISNSSDMGYGIAVDGDENVYVTGYEFVTGQSTNVWVGKYDGNGNELWTRTHNAANSIDGGYGIAVDGSGNVYVSGFEFVSGRSRDIWIRKYNGNGDEIWTMTHNDNNLDDEGVGIAVDESGNVYVTGFVRIIPTNSDIWTRKYQP